MTKACAVVGCARDARVRGWCLLHYERWRKHGDPNALLANQPTIPDAVSFNANHRVKFTKRLWNRWMRETFDHPHQRYLAEGIRDFRGRLNA